MKKVILTLAALVVSAAMVFSFAGCSDKTSEGETTTDSGVVDGTGEADTAADVADEAAPTSEA